MLEIMNSLFGHALFRSHRHLAAFLLSGLTISIVCNAMKASAGFETSVLRRKCEYGSLLQANRRGATVSVQSLDTSKFLYDGERFSDRFLIESHDAGPALELVCADTGKRLARAAGGQRVAGSSEKIADGDWRVIP